MTAPKGSTVRLDLSTPTTSICATNKSARDGSAMAEPRKRATSALLPGTASKVSEGTPSFCRRSAMYFAVACSLPGGLVVLMWIRSASQPWASLAIAVVSPIGEGLGSVLEDAEGNCAAVGKLTAKSSAATAT